ncbi:nuclear transport factor 2 family protein [Streptomyces pseudovenezuelae]|uniref:Ketosteroid isomerase-like protein n=1 Tax=Streptomyces pseudovenezuelae TaxID=67350 RepID=A0ABT6LNL7_9ACTN|nr:nuclear transport factor 2 family protein [Streptomyces pseudovenezuelae]MDH6217913.1 ketosteroid isomerase-like protein [Streptomyces pseudovenezuelae]
MNEIDELHSTVSELTELRSAVKELTEKVRVLEGQAEIVQLVARYGPAVDSGSGEAAAELWTEDGVFDVVGHFTMRGHEDISGMVHGTGHQHLIRNGAAHVLTVPHIQVDGDRATGRGYALNIRWDPDADRFWVARVSANTWRWARTAHGWRVVERVNANLDGTAGHRELPAPPRPDSGSDPVAETD